MATPEKIQDDFTFEQWKDKINEIIDHVEEQLNSIEQRLDSLEGN